MKDATYKLTLYGGEAKVVACHMVLAGYSLEESLRAWHEPWKVMGFKLDYTAADYQEVLHPLYSNVIEAAERVASVPAKSTSPELALAMVNLRLAIDALHREDS